MPVELNGPTEPEKYPSPATVSESIPESFRVYARVCPSGVVTYACIVPSSIRITFDPLFAKTTNDEGSLKGNGPELLIVKRNSFCDVVHNANRPLMLFASSAHVPGMGSSIEDS